MAGIKPAVIQIQAQEGWQVKVQVGKRMIQN